MWVQIKDFIKSAFQIIKTIVWFVWRHAFSLMNGYIGLSVLFRTHYIDIENALIAISIAAALDWLKMKIKLEAGEGQFRGSSSDDSPFRRNYWNSEIIGTPAYVSSLGTSSRYY